MSTTSQRKRSRAIIEIRDTIPERLKILQQHMDGAPIMKRWEYTRMMIDLVEVVVDAAADAIDVADQDYIKQRPKPSLDMSMALTMKQEDMLQANRERWDEIWKAENRREEVLASLRKKAIANQKAGRDPWNDGCAAAGDEL